MKGVRRILIINGKGGCGKTTIATNLAVTYAQRGHQTALMDYDSQAASTDWSQLREESPTNHSRLTVLPMHLRVGMYQTRAFRHQLPADVERIIIDTPSGARERDVDALLKQCDLILVPMLPSPLDIRSGSRFIAELLTHRSYRANPRPIGVIANRLPTGGHNGQSGDANQQKLMHALECLGVECVASFSDSPLYGRAAEDGAGVTELTVADEASIAEQLRWQQLLDWAEQQPRRGQPISARQKAVASSAAAESPPADSPASTRFA